MGILSTIKKHTSKRALFVASAVLVILCIGLGSYYEFVYRPNHRNPINQNIATATDLYNKFESQQLLKTKDYDTYQAALLVYVRAYIDNNNYAAAGDILADIQKNVPQSQLLVDTYQELSAVAAHEHNNKPYETYTATLIAKLKASGDTQDANYFAKQLETYKSNEN